MIARLKYGIALPHDVNLDDINVMLQNPGFDMLELKIAGFREDSVQPIPLLLYKPAGFEAGDDSTDTQNVVVGVNPQSIFDADEKFIIVSKIRNLLDVCRIDVLSVHPDWILFITE